MTRHTCQVALALGLVLSIGSAGAHGQNKTKAFTFSVQGPGNFFPANLGATGAPGDGQIVGDGSGLSAYGLFNDPPIGTDFRLNGKKVGGNDVHYGAAQSLDSGYQFGNFVFYTYVTAPNPLYGNRRIHVMVSDEGEVWFNYAGFFTLDGAAGTLVSRSVFRIVGGTNTFRNASGAVYVVTRTNLADITPVLVNGSPELNAPFEYDFRGIINIPLKNLK